MWSLSLLLLIAPLCRAVVSRDRHASSGRDALDFLRGPLDPWIGLYAVVFVIAAALNHSSAMTPYVFFQFSGYLVFFYAGMLVRDRERVLMGAAWGLLVGATVIGVYGFVTWPDRVPPNIPEPLHYLKANFLAHTNYSALLEMALPVGVALVCVSKRWAFRLIASAAILVLAALVLIGQSKGGWLAVLVCVVIVLAVRFPGAGRRNQILSLVVLTIFAAGVWMFGKDIIEIRFRAMDWSNLRSDLRWLTWDATLRMIRDNPIFGIGPGLYRFDILDHRPVELRHWPPYACNYWLQIAAEVGLAAVLAALGFAYRATRQVLEALGGGGSRLTVLKSSLAAAVLMLAIHDLIDFNLLLPLMASLFCFFLGSIQPLTGPGTGSAGLFWKTVKRSLLVVCLSITALGSVFLGVSDALVRWDFSFRNMKTGIPSEERIRWADGALKVFPWNSRAVAQRAEMFIKLAGHEADLQRRGQHYQKAAEAWGQVLALQPNYPEARWYKALAIIGANGGRVVPEVLDELDLMMRARSGSPWQTLFASAKLVYLMSSSGSDTEAWALDHFETYLEAAPMHADSVFRVILQRNPDARQLALFAGRSEAVRTGLMAHLARENRWQEYASLDLKPLGLSLHPTADLSKIASLIASGLQPSVLHQGGLAEGSLDFELPAGARYLQLNLGWVGAPRRGGAYIRLWSGERLVAGLCLFNPEHPVYWIPLPVESAGRKARLEWMGRDEEFLDGRGETGAGSPRVKRLIVYA